MRRPRRNQRRSPLLTLGVLFLAGVTVLAISYVAGKHQHAPQVPPAGPAIAAPYVSPNAAPAVRPAASPSLVRPFYTVKAGDTLSAIAVRFLGSEPKWRYLAQLNHLKNPNLLSVGQLLRI